MRPLTEETKAELRKSFMPWFKERWPERPMDAELSFITYLEGFNCGMHVGIKNVVNYALPEALSHVVQTIESEN